jgi:hypothetical protein
MAQVEAELAVAVEAEAWLARREALVEAVAGTPGTAQEELPEWWHAAMRPQTEATPVEVQTVELMGELALVGLLVNSPDAAWYGGPYRQLRVFREEPDGWRPTRAVAELWGAPEIYETLYFRFQFGRRDAETVRAVAPALDDTFAQLRRDLGLPPPNPRQRLTVRLVAGPGVDNRIDISELRYGGSTLLVPPPELVPRPATMALTTALHQSVAFPLAVKSFAEARVVHAVPCEWRSLAMGMGLWLRWEENELPSKRRWEQETKLAAWLDELGRPKLADIVAVGQECWNLPTYLEIDLPEDVRAEARPELAATLVDYAVRAHGRKVLPRLIRGFGQHEGWEELAPAVFGMEPAALEAAWQASLE